MTPPWSLTTLRRFLKPYGYSPRTLAAQELPGGADNLNLRLDVDGEILVLRQYRITPRDEIAFELKLIHLLCQRRFPTAPLLARRDGGLMTLFARQPAALFRFVAGRHPDLASDDDAEQVALALARLHQLTRGLDWADARSRTDYNALVQAERYPMMQGGFSDDPDLTTFAAQAAAFRRAFVERVAPHEADLPGGVVHHDVNPGNILLDDRGELIALLDFDEAHIGPFLIDLASLVHYWGLATPGALFDGARVQRLLAAYHARRPLLAIEWQLLPDFILLFYLADAANYVLRALQLDPAARPVAECHSYATFQALQRADAWRAALQPT